MIRLTIAAALIATNAAAHEMTPTYPELKPAYVDGLLVTTMKMWNRREDVSYYEISVFDEQWNPVAFATSNRVIKLNHLEKTSFDLYFRVQEKDRIKYICTTSKLLKDDVATTGVTSKICSKVR